MRHAVRRARQTGQSDKGASRAGFTLIELLVVIAIIVVLVTITAATVSFTIDGDRVNAGARSVQAMISGARDRAIYERQPRGVRLWLNPDDGRTVTAATYIAPAPSWSDGVIQLQRLDVDGNNVADSAEVQVVAGVGTGWWELKRRGLLYNGLRIRIPKGPNGNWHEVNTDAIDINSAPTNIQLLGLSIPYRDPGDTAITEVVAFDYGGPETYELELPTTVLPEEPILLPDQVSIQLDASRIPLAWRPFGIVGGAGADDGSLSYAPFMDIMFSPRGTIIGTAASAGLIHLYVADTTDGLAFRDEFIAAGGDFAASGAYGNFIPADTFTVSSTGEDYFVDKRRIVSVFAQTGAVKVFPVDGTDVSPVDGIADDPFYFAETGAEAN